ncbi:MAG: hypothetical protein HY921_03650 [Elusimicrobia bacterium]|nr:hypothetical protein [Elusimicrobiota bacterium]
MKDLSLSARSSAIQGQCISELGFPVYIGDGFRWIKEAVEFMHETHKHPLPLAALIFMYIETLGKPLVFEMRKSPTTKNKVSLFIEQYMPKLWQSMGFLGNNRPEILSNQYRNGLAHEIFMKDNCSIHEGDQTYVSTIFKNVGIPISININFFVREFLEGLEQYRQRLLSDSKFLELFQDSLASIKPCPRSP